jgi:hypothetical protein
VKRAADIGAVRGTDTAETLVARLGCTPSEAAQLIEFRERLTRALPAGRDLERFRGRRENRFNGVERATRRRKPLIETSPELMAEAKAEYDAVMGRAKPFGVFNAKDLEKEDDL